MIIGTEALDKHFGAVHALDAVTLRIEEVKKVSDGS